jgi:hypothetical protein
MSNINWTSQEHSAFFHWYHLAVSNINNVYSGIWKLIFESNNQVRRLCGCNMISANGFDEQFIRKLEPMIIDPIENLLFGNDGHSEEHSNSDTINEDDK